MLGGHAEPDRKGGGDSFHGSVLWPYSACQCEPATAIFKLRELPDQLAWAIEGMMQTP